MYQQESKCDLNPSETPTTPALPCLARVVVVQMWWQSGRLGCTGSLPVAIDMVQGLSLGCEGLEPVSPAMSATLSPTQAVTHHVQVGDCHE